MDLSGIWSFFRPVVRLALSLLTVASFLLGAILNPNGFLNTAICGAIDHVAAIFPSTPEPMKIGSILDSLALAMPAVGRGIIKEIFVTITAMIAVSLVIKIYKLIPFKAT